MYSSKFYREEANRIHESVNHKYDGYPYVLHLDACHAVKEEFKADLLNKINELGLNDDNICEKIDRAIYFHDVEEDCRMTYNDIKHIIGEFYADIVHAVTNEKGKTRKERAGRSYYLNIRKTPLANFVKICDRIANVRYSRMMGSSMFRKYYSENEHFMVGVNIDDFPNMKNCLIDLFKEYE